MTVRTWSSRAAANNSVSASGPNSLPIRVCTRCLMISAPGDAPRTYRPIIDHACEQFISAVFVHHHLDRLGTGKLHRAAVAAKHLGLADRLLRREQGARFEIAKSPFEHFLGFGRSIVGIVKTVDDDDQPQPILHRGTDHAVAALLGISGLESVTAFQSGQQRIAVLLPDRVPGEFALAK